MTDISLPEAIALFVAVVLALSLVSFLAYGKMTQSGLPPQRKRQVLVSIWLLVCGLIALLFALRVVSGGPLVGKTPGGGIWLGLEPRQIVALVVAIGLLLLGYTRLRGILQPLEAGRPLGSAPSSPTSEADREA